MEDEDNNIHLKNLTVHQANNEEEALNLLFLGDTNRMIAEVCIYIYKDYRFM
jgi:kinesin family protein 6/9